MSAITIVNRTSLPSDDIIQISSGIPDLLPMTNRSPGVHVSDLIHHVCVKTGYHRTYDNQFNMTLMQLGCALETALKNRWRQSDPSRYLEIGEIQIDNIFMTPDFYDVISSLMGEIKYTRLSSDHDIRSDIFWPFWSQVGAYCYGWEIDLCQLHIMHANGDYKDNRDPVYNIWQRRFTGRKLRENWLFLRSHYDEVARLKGV